jgi:hypothetical protein
LTNGEADFGDAFGVVCQRLDGSLQGTHVKIEDLSHTTCIKEANQLDDVVCGSLRSIRNRGGFGW